MEIVTEENINDIVYNLRKWIDKNELEKYMKKIHQAEARTIHLHRKRYIMTIVKKNDINEYLDRVNKFFGTPRNLYCCQQWLGQDDKTMERVLEIIAISENLPGVYRMP